MNITRYILSIFVLNMFLLVPGCKDKVTDVPASNTNAIYGTYPISSFLPLAPGNQWIYSNHSMTESSTILISIKDSTKLSDQTLAFHFTEGVLTNLPDTTLQATEYYSCQNGTIYQGYTASNYVIPLLASPIKSGHVWTYPNGTNGTVTATIISVTSGYYNNQSIDTIVAVRHYHQDNTTGTMDDTIWFARTIGILKKSTMSQVSTDTSYSLQQLISYTFPR